MGTVRQEAVRAITSTRYHLNRVNFKQTHIKDLFAINVFNEEVQRQRPEMEKLQKELQAQMLAHRGEWEKNLQTMRRQMEQQRQELKRKLREMQKEATEI